MSRALVNQLRPHQLVHQLAVLVVMSGFFTADPVRTVHVAGISVLGTLAMLLFSDLQHRHDDAAMGRRRLVHRLGARRVAVGVAASVATLVVLAHAVGGMRCVAFVVGLAGGNALYTLAKKGRRAGLAYFGRFAAGALLVATYRAALPDVALPAVGRLAIAAGLLDLAGNIAGDLRDEDEDRRAGLRTVPLRLGAAWSRRLIALAMLAAHAVMSGAAPAAALATSAALGTATALAAVSAVPRAWRHAAVHGPKLIALLLIGAASLGTHPLVASIACLMVAALWLPSYWAYRWSAAAVMTPGPRTPGPRTPGPRKDTP